MDYNQSQEAVRNAIALMAVEDKPALLNLLKSSGSLVTEISTTDELLDASYKALKDSSRFRDGLSQYMITAVLETDNDANFSNLTEEEKKKRREARGGKTLVGSWLSNILSKDTVNTVVQAGVNYASVSLANRAARSGNQQAIDFERAQAEKFLAQQAAIGTQGQVLQAGSKKNKWVLPVVIGAGVIVLGVVIYFVARKKQ